jgi:hypothetical protein
LNCRQAKQSRYCHKKEEGQYVRKDLLDQGILHREIFEQQNNAIFMDK